MKTNGCVCELIVELVLIFISGLVGGIWLLSLLLFVACLHFPFSNKTPRTVPVSTERI